MKVYKQDFMPQLHASKVKRGFCGEEVYKNLCVGELKDEIQLQMKAFTFRCLQGVVEVNMPLLSVKS